MIIGAEELLKRVKQEGLVQGLCERELVNPEGPGFDLRAGEVFALEGRGFLGKEERETPAAKLIAAADKKSKQPDKVVLAPGEYRLVRTMEEVKMPSGVFGQVFPRSTFFRSGLWLAAGKISPGYAGKLTFGLVNMGPAEFELELGARIAFMVFHEVRGRSNSSRGQWKGGRVAAKREKQV